LVLLIRVECSNWFFTNEKSILYLAADYMRQSGFPLFVIWNFAGKYTLAIKPHFLALNQEEK
jgi:predicted deacetylase